MVLTELMEALQIIMGIIVSIGKEFGMKINVVKPNCRQSKLIYIFFKCDKME